MYILFGKGHANTNPIEHTNKIPRYPSIAVVETPTAFIVLQLN